MGGYIDGWYMDEKCNPLKKVSDVLIPKGCVFSFVDN